MLSALNKRAPFNAYERWLRTRQAADTRSGATNFGEGFMLSVQALADYDFVVSSTLLNKWMPIGGDRP